VKRTDSDLGHALLHQQPRSGYDLRKIFESSPIAYYSDSPGAIYPALRFAFMSEHLDRAAILAFLASLARFRRARSAALTPTGRLAFESGYRGFQGSLRWARRARREIERSTSGGPPPPTGRAPAGGATGRARAR
jgi:hypothetical protein